MPTVPVAQQTQELRPFQRRNTVTATPDSFGAQSGQAIARVGQAAGQASDRIAQAALRLQQREDAELVRQAFVEYDNRLRAQLYDPEKGLYSRTGRAARGVTASAFDVLSEIEREVGDTLNGRQRQEFDARVATVRSGHLNSLSRYESSEFRKAEQETTEALLQGSVESAVAAYQAPELREEYRSQGEREIDKLASLHGWDPERTDIEKRKFRSTLHRGITERMLVDDPSGAREYYQEHIEDIDGGTRLILDKALEEGVTRQRGQQELDRILATTDDPREMNRLAKQIDDPNLRDDVERRVDAEISRRERFRNIEKDRAAEAVWQAVNQAVENGVYPMPEDLPQNAWFRLSGNQQASVLNYIKERRQGIEPKTDELKKLDFLSLPAQEMAKFSSADLLSNYRPHMNDSDWRAVQSAWLAAQEAVREPAKLQKANTVQQAATQAAERYGITVKDRKSTDQVARRAAFEQEFKAEVERQSQALQRDLTQPEYDALGAKLALDAAGRVDPGFFSFEKDVFPFEILSGLEDVPDDVRQQIENALVTKGYPVTEANVRELYRRQLFAK